MPPRIPWMIFSPMRRKKIPAMAVSLPLELEGKEGQQRAGPSCGLPCIQDAHHPEIGSSLPLEIGQELGYCSHFLSLPIIHQYLLHS